MSRFAIAPFLFLVLLGCGGESTPSGSGELESLELVVEGVTTEDAALEVARILTGLDSVKSCVVNPKTGIATCEVLRGTSASELAKALEGLPYTVKAK